MQRLMNLGKRTSHFKLITYFIYKYEPLISMGGFLVLYMFDTFATKAYTRTNDLRLSYGRYE